jgi:hypothetical protein
MYLTAIHLEGHMKRLTRDQIEVLRELVQQEMNGIERGELVVDDPAGILIELRDLRTDLEAMYHATRDAGTELL